MSSKIIYLFIKLPRRHEDTKKNKRFNQQLPCVLGSFPEGTPSETASEGSCGKVFEYMSNISYLVIFLALFSGSFSFSQQNKIKEKKNELTEIRSQISNLEEQVKQKSRKEKETYSTLTNYNHQNFLLNRLINKLHSEEKKKQQEIEKSQQEIGELEKEIQALKKNYSKYVVSIYKYGTPDKWEILFNSDSFEQAVLRYKYLQKFTERRKKDLKELKESKARLIVVKARLQKEKNEKAELAKQKESEEKELLVKMGESKKILFAIRRDKSELRKEISSKRNAEQKIKGLIAKLVEEEKRRREEAERLAKINAKKSGSRLIKSENDGVNSSYNIDLSTNDFASFAALKGRLNWPVSRAKIIRQFGENKNEKLNTVTLNYGVDMKVTGDQNVKAVAEGVVSAIDWIPGYGSVIIITHRGDFRTVYSHLGEIFVNEGDKVKAGSLIGKVGESLEGNILHFEIWNSRDHQDPKVWLARK